MRASTDPGFSFPEPPEGLLTAPEDRVTAQMDSPETVSEAVDDLVAAGFDPDEIYVLCGAKGAERLDVSGRDHGLKGRIYRILEWMGGDEREMVLLPMEEYLNAGGLVVSVPADEEAGTAAAQILGDHGAHSMAHFGKGQWNAISP